jgi:YspA, cpYpsA-related SLOG family
MTGPRLLVTGSRDWTDEDLILAELTRARAELGDGATLVHGDARGADRMAAAIWAGPWRLHVEPHPANWGRDGNIAGYLRNRLMVRLGADLCLAFILNHSRGATMCADLADKADILVRRIEVSS